MTGPQLFTPITVGALVLKNWIVIAKMCQYSAAGLLGPASAKMQFSV